MHIRDAVDLLHVWPGMAAFAVLSVLKIQTQGAISSPQVGGSLASSGLQNNVYDSFLCLSYVA